MTLWWRCTLQPGQRVTRRVFALSQAGAARRFMKQLCFFQTPEELALRALAGNRQHAEVVEVVPVLVAWRWHGPRVAVALMDGRVFLPRDVP